jgi:hypothetical protein
LQVVFLLPDSSGFKMIGERRAMLKSNHHHQAPAWPRNSRSGVVLEDRYARNANGNLSHSRKELLIRPIKDELNAPPASIVSTCPEQLWILDKLPDVQMWSAKVSCVNHCILFVTIAFVCILIINFFEGAGCHDRIQLKTEWPFVDGDGHTTCNKCIIVF